MRSLAIVRGRAVGALVCLGLTSCLVGSTAGGFAPAVGPSGVHTTGLAAGAAFDGELLAAEDTALVILAEQLREGTRVWVVPYPSIQWADFDQIRSARIRKGVRPPPTQLERLRLVSRFPQGVSSEMLERLRRVYESPVTVAPQPRTP